MDQQPQQFERRLHDRWPADGVVTVHHCAGERFGERSTLRILDESIEGLRARSDRPLDPGTLVTITHPFTHGPRNGVVLRCIPCGDGYRIAIRFEFKLAA